MSAWNKYASSVGRQRVGSTNCHKLIYVVVHTQYKEWYLYNHRLQWYFDADQASPCEGTLLDLFLRWQAAIACVLESGQQLYWSLCRRLYLAVALGLMLPGCRERYYRAGIVDAVFI